MGMGGSKEPEFGTNIGGLAVPGIHLIARFLTIDLVAVTRLSIEYDFV